MTSKLLIAVRPEAKILFHHNYTYEGLEILVGVNPAKSGMLDFVLFTFGNIYKGWHISQEDEVFEHLLHRLYAEGKITALQEAMLDKQMLVTGGCYVEH